VFEYGGGTGGGTLTAATIAPSNPAVGDQWIDTSDGTLYLYFNDGDSSQWAQMASVYSINQTPDLTNVGSNLIPSSNVTYNIGNTTNSWNTIYASALITSANANISGNIAAGNISATGNILASYVLGNGSQLSGISTGISTGKAIAMNIVFGG
jgi:ABC-type protease/lipase transport system fused ATPase/permease subunit